MTKYAYGFIGALLTTLLLLGGCTVSEHTSRTQTKTKSYFNITTGELGFYTESDNMVVKYNLTDAKTEIILK